MGDGAPAEGLWISVLGPLEAARDGVPLRLGGGKQRTLLAVLALEVGRVVSVDSLISSMWGDDPAGNPAGTLQVYVSALRRLLGAHDPTPAIVWRSSGYVLDVEPARVDVHRFRRFVTQSRGLAPAARSTALSTALDLWRGPVLADLAGTRVALTMAGPLEDELLTASEDLADAELVLGRHQGLVARLEPLIAHHPLRERLYGLLMVALYRSGRQADALAVFQRARTILDAELGLEPGPDLRALELAVLSQSPSLLAESARVGHETTVRWDPRRTSPACLLLRRGGRYELGTDEVVIGRDDDSDLTLADTRISRRHAAVRPTPAGYEVEDLGSTNGTVLNGEPLAPGEPRLLSDGDQIKVGTAVMTFAA